MHHVQVVILRFLVEPGQTKALRGTLQVIPKDARYCFQDEGSLLQLLYTFLEQDQDPTGSEDTTQRGGISK